MLVFISDLHFADGTAGEHNINPRAFKYFFNDLIGLALRCKHPPRDLHLLLSDEVER